MLQVPAYCRPAAFEAFREELTDIDRPQGLLRAATAIAMHADQEDCRDEVVRTISRLADSIHIRIQSECDQTKLAHLHDVLFDVVGFRGVEPEDYYNPSHSYLPCVLEIRRGIPISLVLIYRSVAECLGLRVEGVNSPGHFMAAVICRETVGETLQYVDPFYDGALLTRDEALLRIESITGVIPPDADPLAFATPTQWLLRILGNLQAIFARHQQERDLLAMQELESLLPP